MLPEPPVVGRRVEPGSGRSTGRNTIGAVAHEQSVGLPETMASRRGECVRTGMAGSTLPVALRRPDGVNRGHAVGADPLDAVLAAPGTVALSRCPPRRRNGLLGGCVRCCCLFNVIQRPERTVSARPLPPIAQSCRFTGASGCPQLRFSPATESCAQLSLPTRGRMRICWKQNGK